MAESPYTKELVLLVEKDDDLKVSTPKSFLTQNFLTQKRVLVLGTAMVVVVAVSITLGIVLSPSKSNSNNSNTPSPAVSSPIWDYVNVSIQSANLLESVDAIGTHTCRYTHKRTYSAHLYAMTT